MPVNPAVPAGTVRYPLRADRARRTHQALVTAARELFAEAGYAATTIEMLAARAGTGRATVFTSVPGGKTQLLKEARDQADVSARLDALRDVARGDGNLLHPIRAALAADASIGEVCGAMRDVFGEYTGGAFF